MKKILTNNYFLILIYLLFALLAFGKLQHAFFQQDEWAIFGIYSYFDKVSLGWFERLFTYGQNTHMIPLSGLLSNLQYKIFGLDFASYAYSSIAMHLLNSGLVAYLAYLFFKKRLPAFIAGLIFLVDSIPSQGVTWIATSSSTVGATLFTLLSLIFLTKFLLYKNEKKFIILSFIFLFTSLLFKESSIFMFLFVPFFWFMFDSKKSYKRISRFLIGIFVVGIFYALPRLLLMLFNTVTVSLADNLTQPSLPVYLFRIISFPFKAISQSIVPANFIYFFADKLLLVGYPQFVHSGIPDIHVSQTIGADIITYILTAIVLLICALFYVIAKNKKMVVNANIIIISVVFISLSSLPFIFIPGNPGYFSLFDGRSLYLSSIFMSILLANIFLLIYSFLGKKKIIPVFVLFFMFFIIFNVLNIERNIESEVKQGEMRKSILNQIQEIYPKLPKEVIFYTESDSSFYGLPIDDKIMPFLSGFGQTLLVWYEEHGQDFPACFFQDKYLYAIIEQGYKECNGRGYGYFRKFDSLKEAIVQFKINPNNIISFRYISQENRLEDISSEIREKLEL